jgi:predicted SAM-dependent methyltransferase
MPKFINLGCGSRFCSDPVWTNVDFNSSNPSVIAHNLLDGIPFPDSTFDAAYHSHVLEHMAKDDGAKFIGECLRALKPGGVLRVAVPDLEQICRLYLNALEQAEQGDVVAAARYEWIKLEMYDQTTRTVSGGEMAKYLGRPDLPGKEFIIARVGTVARKLIQAAQASAARPKRATRPSQTLRDWLKSALLTRHEQVALRIGLFRLSGEVHQQMYDKYSLGALLAKAGFTAARRCSASDSQIPGWGAYFLDVDPDGFEHGPSSLYMEGIKPA